MKARGAKGSRCRSLKRVVASVITLESRTGFASIALCPGAACLGRSVLRTVLTNVPDPTRASMRPSAARGSNASIMIVRDNPSSRDILHAGLSEIDTAMAAEERGVTVSPVARFSIAPTEAQGLVLGFGGTGPSQIQAGVAVLARILKSLVGCRACQLTRSA